MNRFGTKLVGFKDGYYVILDGKEYELGHGELIIALSELNIVLLKNIVLSCPHFYESLYPKWECFAPLQDWLKDKLIEILPPVISGIVFIDMFNFIHDIFIAHGSVEVNPDQEDYSLEQSMKKVIFLNTDYDDYGAGTIGHLLLTALCCVGFDLTIARGALKTIAGGDRHTIIESISPKHWVDTYVLCQFTSIFGEIQPVYIITTLDEMLLLELSKICENGIKIKKCQNCGMYFVPESRTDEIYCNRTSPQNTQMTCKKYGSQKLWYDRLKNDEVAKLARNVYSAKQMLVRRNPDILAYREMFEYFKGERKRWEKLVKSGKKSKEEYTAWLNEMKAKKVL